jgi:hypothetical protein
VQISGTKVLQKLQLPVTTKDTLLENFFAVMESAAEQGVGVLLYSFQDLAWSCLYIHMYIYVHIHIYMCVCACVRVYVCVFVCVCVLYRFCFSVMAYWVCK